MKHKWLAQGLIHGMDRDHVAEVLEAHGQEAIADLEDIAQATGGDLDDIAATVLEVNARKEEIAKEAEPANAIRVLRDRFNNPIIEIQGNRAYRREQAALNRKAARKHAKNQRKRDMR